MRLRGNMSRRLREGVDYTFRSARRIRGEILAALRGTGVERPDTGLSSAM